MLEQTEVLWEQLNFPLCVGQTGKQGPDQKRLCSYGVALKCYVNRMLLKDFELCIGKYLKRYLVYSEWASLVAQWQRTCLPTQETWVLSLGQEDPQE